MFGQHNNSRIFQRTCPWWVSSLRSSTLQFLSMAIDLREALAKKEFTCHCHLSLKSAKLKCVSNVTIYNLPSAGMISHLGSTGWTSTLIHKTGKKRKSWQIRECHQKRRPTVLYTLMDHCVPRGHMRKMEILSKTTKECEDIATPFA